MFVPVVVVPTVEVTVVHVVHMVVVGYGHVTTALPVLVRVVLVYIVAFAGALVPVVVVDVVQMPVVHVVHMVVVGYGHVTTPLTMLVRVSLVHQMCGRHTLPRTQFLLDDSESSNNVSIRHLLFKDPRRWKQYFAPAYTAEWIRRPSKAATSIDATMTMVSIVTENVEQERFSSDPDVFPESATGPEMIGSTYAREPPSPYR